MTEIAPTEEAQTWCQANLDTRSLRVRHYETLAAEASHRSFWRAVCTDPQATSFILMVSPPALEQNDAFERFARLFGDHSIPVPQILASDPHRGFYLQSDLGRTQLADLYDTEDADAAILAAIMGLIDLQAVSGDLTPYTRERIETELSLFDEWFIPWSEQTLDSSAFSAACQPLVTAMLEQPFVCIHRDYHSRNLIYESGRLGIVDFQDALLGPAFYDLACLLHDCYYTFEPSAVDRWLDEYLARAPERLGNPPHAAARRWLDFTGLQRQLKAIGIFARLKLRDGKTTHLSYIEDNLNRAKSVSTHYKELEPLSRLLSGLR